MSLQVGDLCVIVSDHFTQADKHYAQRYELIGKTVVLLGTYNCTCALCAGRLWWRVTGLPPAIAGLSQSCLRKIPPGEMVDGLFNVRPEVVIADSDDI